ncbi:hypothetical protein [Acinetobacter junii]|uniref:hypothetical protein n=1 Tax=Acinetobacter junii TaxID=40215 RepID=UPI003AF85AE3
MNKARDSLIRNFTIVLLKKLINDAKDYKEIYRISTALNAIEVIHRELYRKILTEKLSSIVRSLAVEKLDRVIPLIRHVEDSWSYLEADIRQKIQTYVENLPKEEIENIDIFLSIQGLKSFAEKRLKKATRTELDEAIFFVIPLQVSDRIIELYSESRNFDQANNFASTVIRYATDYSKEQIQKIISVCGDNDQIKHSFDVGSVINSIRKNKNANDDEIDGWLVEADLKRFAKIKDNEADVGN